MAYSIHFDTATSAQIEAALCRRLESIRLHRNTTQEQLAGEAGVSIRTVRRLEKGQGVSLDTFIRVMMALRIQNSLEALLPDPDIRPIERIMAGKGGRRRAHPARNTPSGSSWTWGDGKDSNEQ